MNTKFIKDDILAGIVVFFVAVPLCLGIAVASGVPPISGLIAGIIGGIVIGFVSKSQLSVSGPAAGLVAIVLAGIESTGGFQAFFLAVFIAGIFQFLLGLARAGTIAYFFPSSVIKGMLTAIGIIIIMKQFTHFIGYDTDYEGDLSFLQTDGENTFSAFFNAFNHIHPGVALTGLASILAIALWDKYKKGSLKVLPGALMGVIVGLLFNSLFQAAGWENLIIRPEHLVNIPVIESASGVGELITFPDFSQIGNKEVWVLAITIALVASIETLLTIEATDKIDPMKRVTPTNRELLAQGIGNSISGLLGGLPITSVIVRSSASINSGGKTKLASIFHGIFLLLGTVLFAAFLNKIPLTSLAAILLVTGWKLANPKVFKSMFELSIYQWLPFIVSVFAIVFTDLLTGILIGITVSIVFLLIKNLQNTHFITTQSQNGKRAIRIELTKEVSFLNKATMLITLDRIKPDSHLIIDASQSFYIDYDVLEVIREFATVKAPERNIKVDLMGFKEHYGIIENENIDLETT